MESHRDITTDIPDLFLDSGAPVAPTLIKFIDFPEPHTPRRAHTDQTTLGRLKS